MNIKARLRNALIRSSFSFYLVTLVSATAVADGYYHYTAIDMDIKAGDWTSNYQVKRMYWHPWTANGHGASFQSTLAPHVFGPGKQWHWVFLYDVGGGVFYGFYLHYAGGVEYKDTLRVIRTNSPWGIPKTGVADEYAWTPYAWVNHKVYADGNPYPVAQALVLMEFRDADWR